MTEYATTPTRVCERCGLPVSTFALLTHDREDDCILALKRALGQAREQVQHMSTVTVPAVLGAPHVPVFSGVAAGGGLPTCSDCGELLGGDLARHECGPCRKSARAFAVGGAVGMRDPNREAREFVAGALRDSGAACLGWISIVVYEGAPNIVAFATEKEARAYHARASENWSEHFLCAVVERGPKSEPLVPAFSAPVGEMPRCDEPKCDAVATRRCTCARCGREGGFAEERFHACDDHLESVETSHRRVRGRVVFWGAIT